jgi:hypothetical protein
MQNLSNSLSLLPNQWQALPIRFFKHATDGHASSTPTEVKIKADDDFLYISFDCFDNPNAKGNTMSQHNDPLYNQEVFEVFIAPGHHDSAEYLEVEINPNNAIWVGKINNPALGEAMQTLQGMVDYRDAAIIHSITQKDNSWHGEMQIPFQLIGKNIEGAYRLNFYRIRAKTVMLEADWECSANNCDFLCWVPTMSGSEPAFHRPKNFGFLQIGKP